MSQLALVNKFIEWGRAVCPGTRWWIADKEYERLASAINADLRVGMEYPAELPTAIMWRNSIAIMPKRAYVVTRHG